MPHFLPSFRKANISLLVIFVLLASSLIALLTMHQIQNLMSYGATTSNYFRAYYLAKAGLELALTEANIREAGFEMEVLSGDAIVAENVLTGYEGFEPYFTVKVQSQTNQHTGTLETGASVVIPLFLDNKNSSHFEYLAEVKNTELTRFGTDQIGNIEGSAKGDKELSFGMFTFSGDNFDEMTFMVMQTGTSLNIFLKKILSFTEDRKETLTAPHSKTYLTIVNTSSEKVEFTLKGEKNFALPESTIMVQAHYGDTEVGLEAVFREAFPDFLQGIYEDNATTSN